MISFSARLTPQRRNRLTGLFLLLSLLVGGCAASPTATNSAERLTPNTAADSLTSAAEDTSLASTRIEEPSSRDLADAEAIASPSSPYNDAPSPRLLTPAELGWVERNWPTPRPNIVIDQSFWLPLRDVGEAAFVTIKLDETKLRHALMTPDGALLHTLPAHEDAESWRLYEVKAIAFMELDFDGSEPDAIVIADYITGVGPTGSQPFPVTTVYFNQGQRFTTDASLNRLLTERGVTTIAEAEKIMRDELQFLP